MLGVGVGEQVRQRDPEPVGQLVDQVEVGVELAREDGQQALARDASDAREEHERDALGLGDPADVLSEQFVRWAAGHEPTVQASGLADNWAQTPSLIIDLVRFRRPPRPRPSAEQKCEIRAIVPFLLQRRAKRDDSSWLGRVGR